MLSAAEEENDGETDWSWDFSFEGGNYGGYQRYVTDGVGDEEGDEEDEDQTQPDQPCENVTLDVEAVNSLKTIWIDNVGLWRIQISQKDKV